MEHDVYVRSHWHNDSTSGLEVICTCGQVLLDRDEDEVELGQVQNAALRHWGTQLRPVKPEPHVHDDDGSCCKPREWRDYGWV